MRAQLCAPEIRLDRMLLLRPQKCDLQGLGNTSFGRAFVP